MRVHIARIGAFLLGALVLLTAGLSAFYVFGSSSGATEPAGREKATAGSAGRPAVAPSVSSPSLPRAQNVKPESQTFKHGTRDGAEAALVTPEASAEAAAQMSGPTQERPEVEVDLGRLHQLLPRDAILPIYDPQFVATASADLDPNELVIGVEINGESKAYPIGPLVFREMVNDTVGGVPVLVTW